MSTTPKPLTARQIAFGRAYVELNNATQAAIKAGYKPSSADECGYRLLRHRGVKNQISKLRHHEAERAKDRLNVVYNEIGHAISRRGTDFIDEETGEFIPIHDLPERANASIDAIEIEEKYDKDGGKTIKTKLKLVSKYSAMDMAVKVLGGYAKTGDETTVNIDNRRVTLVLPHNGRDNLPAIEVKNGG